MKLQARKKKLTKKRMCRSLLLNKICILKEQHQHQIGDTLAFFIALLIKNFELSSPFPQFVHTHNWKAQ